MVSRRVLGLVRLFRFELPFTAGVCVVLGQMLALDGLPFLFGLLTAVYLVPILLMDAVIAYAAVRLLQPSTPNPRAYIRAIYLSGSAAVIIFILLHITR